MAKQNTNNNSSWVRGKCIGKGSFGTVSVAVNKSNGTVFAVKSVDIQNPCNNNNNNNSNQVWSLENEIRILRSLSNSSPYIVNFLGDDVSHESLTTYRNMHVEYMPNGTVSDLGADVDERLVRSFTWCIVSALKYIHDRGIVHCDVKGKNVLVGPNSSFCKLADFGSAIELEACTAQVSPRGSPLWMAPEVIRGEFQGPESDVWSLGCTIIEMITGKPAWEDKGLDTLSRIGFSAELPELPTRLSKLGVDFLEKCLKREASQRWSCDQLLQHPFLLSVCSPPVVSVTESSPRCVLDWVDSEFGDDDEVASGSSLDYENCGVSSARERIGKLVTKSGAIWESDGWVEVRSDEEGASVNCGERTKMEYVDLTRTEGETAGTSSVYSNSMWIRREFWNSGGNEHVHGPTSGLQGGAGWSCRYGSQKLELAVEMGFHSLCNLLVLCCLTIFKYILLVFFVIYILCLAFLALICACDCYYLCFGFRRQVTAKMQEYNNAFSGHHFVLSFEENISNSTIFHINDSYQRSLAYET